MADGRLPVLVRGACPHDCPDTCAWSVEVAGDRAVRLIPDAEHPFTAGGLCTKVNRFIEDRVESPDRLLHPLRRVGPKGEGRFERVGWDEAIDDIASRWRTIIDQDGPTAILPYSFMGTQGFVHGMLGRSRFFGALGASELERSICGRNADAGIAATYGSTSGGIDPEDIEHARFIVLWGVNTVQTNLHLWPFVRRAKEAGATVVVIDPVRTRTAAGADWHVQPLPGTDAALALGMAHVIVEEGLLDADYVAEHASGFDAYRARLHDYSPEQVSRLTGLDADEIVQLARAYATTRPAAIRILVGLAQHENGAQTVRAVACLPTLVGAWRDRGGGLVAQPGDYLVDATAIGRLMRPPGDQRVINMMQLGQALTDPDLAPPIRSLFVFNSNPAAIAPEQNAVLAGLARPDLFTVVHEHLLTDTARYADYVLPATTQVEQWDLMFSWGTPYLTMNVQAVPPMGEALSNTQVFRRLGTALGIEDELLYRTDVELIQAILDSSHPWMEGITFDRLVTDGWAKLRFGDDFRPHADGGFGTDDGRCQLYSPWAADHGFDPLPGYEPPLESPAGDPALAARYPLMLLTPKLSLHFLNSSYGATPRHLKAEKEPWLELHPDDASARGIADGDLVEAFNDRGAVQMRARVGDRVRAGVVAMPTSWWPSKSPGGRSANALTSQRIAAWGHGATYHDVLVEVRPCAAAVSDAAPAEAR